MIVLLSLIVILTLIIHFALQWDARQVPSRDRRLTFTQLTRQAKLMTKAFLKLSESMKDTTKIMQGFYEGNISASTGTHYSKTMSTGKESS